MLRLVPAQIIKIRMFRPCTVLAHTLRLVLNQRIKVGA
jgi:hypothetical protein